jgi:hypothetical protein
MTYIGKVGKLFLPRTSCSVIYRSVRISRPVLWIGKGLHISISFSDLIVIYVSHNCKQNRKTGNISALINLHSNTSTAFNLFTELIFDTATQVLDSSQNCRI